MNPFNSHPMIIQCLWGARLKHPHCCVPASWGPARLMCGESGEFCLPQQSWGVQYDAECSHPSTTTLHQSWTGRPVNMRGSPRSDTLQPGDTPLHITGNTHDHQVCLRLCLCLCRWDGSGHRHGWIFGKVPNSLWPPLPPHFRKIILVLNVKIHSKFAASVCRQYTSLFTWWVGGLVTHGVKILLFLSRQ